MNTRIFVSGLLIAALALGFAVPAHAQTTFPDTLIVTIVTNADQSRTATVTVPAEINQFNKAFYVRFGVSSSGSSFSNVITVPAPAYGTGNNIRELSFWTNGVNYKVTADWKWHKADRNLVDGTYTMTKK